MAHTPKGNLNLQFKKMANLFNFQVMIKFSHILCVSSAYLVDLLTMYILIQYTILDFNHRHFFLLCFLGGTSSSSVLYSFNVPLILIYIHTIALILVKSWHHRWCSNDNSQGMRMWWRDNNLSSELIYKVGYRSVFYCKAFLLIFSFSRMQLYNDQTGVQNLI